MPAFKDLTNQRFGKLIVKYPLKERKNNKIVWHCQCDCGAEKDILGSSLTKEFQPTRSCGCLQKENTRKANQKDLSGMVFGYLTVLKRASDSPKWVCQCKCGNITMVDTTHLNTGHTQSCGCLQKERTSERSAYNLTGETIGKLFVIGLNAELSKPKHRIYTCKCECGNICYVSSQSLLQNAQNCGCEKTISRGESKIRQLLTEYNIPFESEKTFDSCINPKTGRKLRFDFYVNNSYLIEYDGKQHFVERENSLWESLEDVQYRDELKNQWCKENNIPLIRIPYTDYTTLTIDDLLLSTDEK